MIPTARGLVPVSDLGTTLMHEHVILVDAEVPLNFPEYYDEEAIRDGAVRELVDAKRGGVQTIVDLTAPGLGRNIGKIVEVAERVDINIILASGFYIWHDLPLWLKRVNRAAMYDGEDVLTRRFVRDIEEGIGETSIRAAVLKCVTERYGLTEDIERVLRSVGEAHGRTGVPITTHADANTRRGLDQQRVFREVGVDLGKVIIGHCGDTDDLDYLRQVADSGSYLGMDRFGMDDRLGLGARLDVVAELCSEGYADRLLLSTDYGTHVPVEQEVIRRSRPDHRYSYIRSEVVPGLRAAGVSDSDIALMMDENPRRIFS